MNGRIAALAGRVTELTAAQLDGMETRISYHRIKREVK